MSESRNPYIEEGGQPSLRKSVVAFIDILGYQDMVMRAAENSESQILLDRLHAALKKARKHVDPDDPDDVVRKYSTKDFSAFRAFTDNIVIGHPVHSDAEIELGSVFDDLAYFQMTMTLEGFFIRGGIAIGDLYMDDIAVYGKGLIEAYKAENSLARDPRIVLSQSAREAVDRHLEYYGRGPHAPQNRDLLKDVDGQIFLNYMGTLVREDEEGIYREQLAMHKDRIEEKLREFAPRPPILSKYLWAASYHNYFCDDCPYIDEASLIDTQNLSLKPVHIINEDIS